jgi:chromosome segregation ATPase
MLLYAVVVYNRAHSIFKLTSASNSYQQTLVSQIADSVYFLGFLWTLWALIDSFVLKNTATSTSVFRTFGYALVTTSCGTFLRLGILQFRFTAIDQNVEADVSIEEKLQHFGIALTASATTIGQWNRFVRDSSETFRSLDEDIGESLKDITAQSRDAVVQVSRQHKELVAQTTQESIAGIHRSTQELSARLAAAVSEGLSPLKPEVVAVAEAFKKANASLRISVPAFTERLRTAAEEIEKGQAALALLRQAADKGHDSIQVLGNASDTLAKELAKIDEARGRLIEMVTATMTVVGDRTAAAVKEAIGNTDWRQIVSVKVELGQLNDKLEALDKHVQAITTSVGSSSQSIDALKGRVDKKIDLCLQELREIKGQAGGLSAAGRLDEEALTVLRELHELLKAAKERRSVLWPFR